MAQPLNTSGLTLTPNTIQSIKEIVNILMFEQPSMDRVLTVLQGITVKQQLVLAGRMSKTGIKDDSCTRPNSGAGLVLTQKYADPQNVGDTLEICQKDLDPLFAAYYNNIKKYTELFDIEGSDEQKLLLSLVAESAMKSVLRLAWLGDKDVAEADGTTAGVINSGLVKFYDSVDGLWKKIFAGVLSGDIGRYTINENAEATTILQTDLADGRSIEIFEALWKNIDPALKSADDKLIIVTGGLFENYRQYLSNKGVVYDINILQNGLSALKWNNIDVIDYSNVWDIDLLADFVNNTNDEAYHYPNRAILFSKKNLLAITANQGDMQELDLWYDKDTRLNKIAFGYTLDANYLSGKLIKVAY